MVLVIITGFIYCGCYFTTSASPPESLITLFAIAESGFFSISGNIGNFFTVLRYFIGNLIIVVIKRNL